MRVFAKTALTGGVPSSFSSHLRGALERHGVQDLRGEGADATRMVPTARVTRWSQCLYLAVPAPTILYPSITFLLHRRKGYRFECEGKNWDLSKSTQYSKTPRTLGRNDPYPVRPLPA